MLHIVCGPDEYLRQLHIAALLEPYSGDATTTIVHFDDHAAPEAILAAVQPLPLFAETRVVITHGLLPHLRQLLQEKEQPQLTEQQKEDAKKRRKELLKTVRTLLQDLPETTVLILDEPSREKTSAKNKTSAKDKEKDAPGPGGKERPGGCLGSLPKDLGELVPKEAMVEIGLPQGQALTRWMEERARRCEVTLGHRVTARLEPLAGQSMRLLEREIEKLATYVGAGGTITEGDVEALVPLDLEIIHWKLLDAIRARHVGKALATLQRLLRQGEVPIALLGTLGSHFRSLAQAHDLLQRGASVAEVGATLKQRSYSAERTCEQARRFTMKRIQKAYDLLVQEDVRLKRSRGDPAANLELLVVQLCRSA